VVARFPDDLDSPALVDYRHGQGVDPLSGAEAVISHLIVRQFQIPCAHAPALVPLPLDPTISPRSAAEEIGYTFLSCVLVGLSRAPQFVADAVKNPNSFWSDQVNAVLIPASACGGSAILSFSQAGQKSPLIIAIEDNTTQMRAYPETLGIKAVRVKSYLEAIGLLVAHRANLNFDCFQPNFSSLHRLT
ncbi:MAG: DUF3326 domain-containing protein, partial [Microcystaceae cyanobacterium]